VELDLRPGRPSETEERFFHLATVF
jgi:hypothetical protein